MKLTKLYLEQCIDEVINEIITEESNASKEAHKKGLTSVGWGKWKDKSGKIVAKTENGKLVKSTPITPKVNKEKSNVAMSNSDKLSKPLTKKEMEDKTAILPGLVTSLELDKRIKDLYDTGDKTNLKTLEDNQDKISKTIEKKTLDLYNNNARFRKQMSTRDPRSKLRMYINHWLDSEISKLKK